MKVILNRDLAPLGEEGDVKEVARGYARNYLFPRNIALPYNEGTVKLFESRREEIEARKVQKRNDAAGIREKLESLELSFSMPAGANGKLYGAVTSQTIADELSKQGYQIERKRIELAGNGFKSVGKYKVTVKLYESAFAEIGVTVTGQAIKTESAPAHPRGRGRVRHGEAAAPETPADGTAEAQASADAGITEAAAETAAGQDAAPPPETSAAESGNGAAEQA
ncbi:MAG: 50S ribosomal protein L9 [Treponema sp.]|jgi:large subunit ribosomal protein L9|nr:50S ribosomal protein L9 [Treponema sp.]